MIRFRYLTTASLFIAAGIAAGLIFHTTGIGGQIALPLHYPAFLAGFVLGWRWGVSVGFIVPLLSALVTGMPPLIPSALLMAPELAVYGNPAQPGNQPARQPLFARRVQTWSPPVPISLLSLTSPKSFACHMCFIHQMYNFCIIFFTRNPGFSME